MASAAFAKVNESFHLFFNLPEEMSLHILSFLSAADMCTLARTSQDTRRFSLENMLWRKLCKKSGWVIARSVVNESADSFNYRKYYTEKHLISKSGSMQWTEQTKPSNTPSKRFKHSATVVGKHMIFIGGQETDTKRFNEIVYYDTETMTFSQPTIKGDRVPNFSRHTASLVGSKIYTFGGYDGQGTNFGLSVFDPYARIWMNVPPAQQKGVIPASRTNHAAAAVGKNMYIFGGNNNDQHGRYQVLGDLSVLNTQTMTWTLAKTTGAIPCARSGHTLTAIGKNLYLFGGGVWSEREGWMHKFNDLHVLDTETMVWTKPECSGNVNTSTFPIAFAVGRFLFVFGGGSKQEHCVTNDLYVLDTYTYSWSTPESDGVKPQPRDMGTASVVGDNVYLLGGYAGGAVDFFDRMNIPCSTRLSVHCV